MESYRDNEFDDDLYEVLGIAADARQEDIKQAYRRAALVHHPDKVPQADRDESHKKFVKIGKAYTILSDPESRRKYDAVRQKKEPEQDELDILFDNIFDKLDEIGERASSFRSRGREPKPPKVIDPHQRWGLD